MAAVPTIRLATPSDAEGIAEMSRSDIEHGLGWSWREPRVLAAIRDRTTNVAVMTEADALVGFGIMQYRGETAHLTLFAIRQSHRHQGLGSELVRWLEKPARIAGIERLRVEARADNGLALAFYHRLGFRTVKTVAGYYSGLVDAVQLEKKF
jgi:[ribosomal protein S18]-alanine N-acetyltransferase